MSTRNFITVMVVALVLFILALLPVAIATAETDVYPKAAVVVDISFDVHGEVVVTVEDGEGFLWSFYLELDEETDVELGDVVALIMWEAGTPDNIFDDEILDVVNEHFKAQ